MAEDGEGFGVLGVSKLFHWDKGNSIPRFPDWSKCTNTCINEKTPQRIIITPLSAEISNSLNFSSVSPDFSIPFRVLWDAVFCLKIELLSLLHLYWLSAV